VQLVKSNCMLLYSSLLQDWLSTDCNSAMSNSTIAVGPSILQECRWQAAQRCLEIASPGILSINVSIHFIQLFILHHEVRAADCPSNAAKVLDFTQVQSQHLQTRSNSTSDRLNILNNGGIPTLSTPCPAANSVHLNTGGINALSLILQSSTLVEYLFYLCPVLQLTVYCTSQHWWNKCTKSYFATLNTGGIPVLFMPCPVANSVHLNTGGINAPSLILQPSTLVEYLLDPTPCPAANSVHLNTDGMNAPFLC
jgi:hypothetical protein